jgi:PAS domain S-box-containing protein
MPDISRDASARPDSGVGRLVRLDLKFGLTVALAALPFATGLLLLAGQPDAWPRLSGHWVLLSGVALLALAGLLYMRHEVHRRIRELHMTARALVEGGEAGAAREAGAVRLAVDRFGTEVPGMVAQFNRMAAQIERQRRELAAAAAQFRSMIEGAPEAIIVADYRTGLVVEANAASARLFGTTRERLVGSSAIALSVRPDLSSERLHAEIRAVARRVLAGENVVNEWTVSRPDGSRIPVEARWMRLPGEGELLRASIVDVTERREAEIERERLAREAEENLERLRQIVETTPYACVITSADGRVQVWNPAAERMFGWSAAEMLGRNSLEIVVPAESREAVQSLFARIREGEPAVSVSHENLTRDGGRVYCEWSNARLNGRDGRLIGFLSMAIDVTARVAAERSLKESEARFRQLTSLSSDWYWEQDEEFRFVRADQHARRGDKPLGEAVGMRRWERPGSRPVGTTWEAHRRDLEAHRPFAHLVIEMTRPDGLRSYVAVRGEPVFDAGGRFTGYRGVGSDISERYRSDLARAGERKVYELLARDATLPEVMGALCLAIEAALARPGIASMLVLEAGLLKLMSAPNAPAAWAEHLAAGVPAAANTGACGSAAHLNDTVIAADIASDAAWTGYRDAALACGFASAWSTPVRGSAGEVLATFAVYCATAAEPMPEDLELTRNAAALAGVLLQRFRAQAAQRELDLRYRSLIELAQEGVTLHRYGIIEYANPAMARILREPDADALIGTNLFDRYDAQSMEQERRRQRRIMELGQSVGYVELRMRAGDGEFVDVEAAAGPVEIGGRRLAQSYIRDISGRKWAEREMQRLNGALEAKVTERTAELSAAVRELESFSYTVAHDLRAPLRAVDGYAQLLRAGAGENLDDASRRDVDQIIASARRMSELIDGLLEFSRLSRGSASYQRVATQVIVQGVVAEAAAAFAHSPSVEMGALPDVYGDPAMLRQVWSNLIFNAFKFTSKTTDAHIAIESTVEGGDVVFSVRDNGAGFDADYAGKLFGMFQRLHSRSEFEGTGVGLAIVKRVVERHHGRVWADGAVGRGATLRFSMPVTSIVQMIDATDADP